MTLEQRDELFDKIRRNKEAYKSFCDKSIKIDEEYCKKISEDISKYKDYNLAYQKDLKLLAEEKEKLDSEWKELNTKLREIIYGEKEMILEKEKHDRIPLDAGEVKKVIEAFEQRGLVTRMECFSLDSREFARKMTKELHNRGYENAIDMEVALENYRDYSYAIYDIEKYDITFIQNYMKEKVLSENV